MSDNGTPVATAPSAAPSDASATTSPVTTDSTASPAQPNWTEFVGSLERLNETLGGKLDQQVAETRTIRDQLAQPREEAPIDLDTLSRADLVSHIVGTISREVQEQIRNALNPLVDQVTNIQRDFTTSTVSQQIEKLRGDHKDFKDWQPEMVELAKAHTTLSVEQLYNLARASNGAKAKELDTKYTPPAPTPTPRWGGLTPGMPGSGVNGTVKPLTAAEAGREAYREVAARHPGILAALESM